MSVWISVHSSMSVWISEDSSHECMDIGGQFS